MHDDNCLFCKIVRGEIPAAVIYESDKVLAFLDIAPVRAGHALVVPKDHYPALWDVPTSLAVSLLEAQQKVARAFLTVLGAQGVNVGMNNNPAAGQMVFHAHWHLIPRMADDGLKLWPQQTYDSPEEMQGLASTLRQALMA